MTPHAEPSPRLQRIVLTVLTAVVAASRPVPLSRTPWDWDEVLFSLAVGHYDVALHQPHPAGFPLFVLLARIARVFVDDNFAALQVVSVLASMCVFPVAYWLARAFRFDFIASVSTALLLSFLPNVWFYGGTAFSDLLAMVLFLAAIAAYLSAGQDARRYLLASLLFTAALLVRPQNALVVVFPWTFATVRLVRAKKLRAAIGGTCAVVLLVAIGYGIAAYLTGFEKYAETVAFQAGFVKRADSIAAGTHRPPFLQGLRMQLDPYEAGKASIVINVLAAIAIVLGRRKVVAEVLLTFAPFFVFTLLAANPIGASRLSLTYMAGIVLLTVEGVTALARFVPRAHVAAHAVALAILLGRLIPWVLPAFDSPRDTASPPVAAAMWLERHAPRDATIFVAHGIWPWARYYVHGRPLVLVENEIEIVRHPDGGKGWYIAMGVTEGNGATAFVRERDRIWNIVTKRNFEAYVRPVASIVAFGDGWYGPEWDGPQRWRWGARRTTLHLPPTTGSYELQLTFHVPVDAIGRPVDVRFTLDGASLDTIQAKAHDNVVSYRIDMHGVSRTLVIETSDSFSPASKGGEDTRDLGIMLRGWNWRRT